MSGGEAGLLLTLGVVLALYMAWSVGANDVANAMGTSVGSRALTLGQAVLVAGIFEFVGAYFFGAEVSDTVRRGIVDAQDFAHVPRLLVLGMLAALLAAGLWLHLASFLGLPVSTTHSIVGAVAGFGLMEFGVRAVRWPEFGRIAASWIISPMAGGALGFLMFHLIRRLILDRADPARAALRWMPLLLTIVLTTLVFAFFEKGAARLAGRPIERAPLLLGAAAVSLVASLGLAWMTRRRTEREPDPDPIVHVERIFGYLQVLTACYVALSHGANDVANAIGPLSAIAHVVRTGAVEMSVPVPGWVLALGGAGIVLGLGTFGYRVMMTIGMRIMELSPTRGFAAEFGAATTVLICSLQGLPVSTTHTLVGAVVGVGFARGLTALNHRVLYGIVTSWFFTVPLAGALSMTFYLLLKAIFA